MEKFWEIFLLDVLKTTPRIENLTQRQTKLGPFFKPRALFPIFKKSQRRPHPSQAYCDKYSERSWNNIKNTQKGIKSLICYENCNIQCTNLLSLDNGNTVTNPYDIANTFNNCVASIIQKKKSLKCSHKHFSYYLLNESSSTIFLQATDK